MSVLVSSPAVPSPASSASPVISAETARGEYTHSVYDSIRKVNWEEWNAVRDASRDPFMDPRFIEAVENSMGYVCRFRHVLLRDGSGKPVAAACLCLYIIDGASLAEGSAKKILALIGRLSPWLMQQRMILCGLPVSTGDSHLRFTLDADRTAVLTTLDRLICEFAREERARFIIFKEFGPEGCRDLAPLESLGYRRADSYPMNYAVTDYTDFDDYLSRIPSKRRRMLRGSLKKLAKCGVRLVHVPGGEQAAALYTDEVHRLYEAVYQRSEVQFDHLPAEFLRELARLMPDNTTFTFAYRGDKIIGYSASVFSDTTFHGVVLGIDYDVNRECQVYFNLMYDALDVSLKRKPRQILLGQTADGTKHAKLDCYQVPVSIYVKGGKRSIEVALKLGFKWFFPPRPITHVRETDDADESADASGAVATQAS